MDLNDLGVKEHQYVYSMLCIKYVSVLYSTEKSPVMYASDLGLVSALSFYLCIIFKHQSVSQNDSLSPGMREV